MPRRSNGRGCVGRLFTPWRIVWWVYSPIAQLIQQTVAEYTHPTKTAAAKDGAPPITFTQASIVSQPQYPQQFPPDFSQYQPVSDPLAPARRASIILFVLGGLCVMGSGCIGVAAWTLPMDEMLAKAKLTLPAPPPGMTMSQFLQVMYTGIAFLGICFGISLVVVGLFVRRGSRAASITAIALCIPAALFFLCNLGSVFSQSAGNPLILVIGLCATFVPFGLLVLTCVWLIAALRQLPSVQFAQQQYQMQMWQYHQQQAAAHQQPTPPPVSNDPWQRGYGMTPPPPPPGGPSGS
jgi:hypothetical protein